MSDLLAGKISNGDEDEVENELEQLEREVNGVKETPPQKLPDAPTDELQRKETEKERWARRAREQQEEREALLA
jgi:charged multivesicular body protein 6